MFKTDLTRLLNIKYPIIGAPMFLVSYEELVIAVSKAGGLGMFPLPNYRTLEDLDQALKTIRTATEQPIGVNIHLSGKFPWKEQLQLCLEAGVTFFLTSLGDPGLILEEVHQKGGLVFADVVSLNQGLRAKEQGVDGLVAVAAGAGGHGGKVPTTVLVPYLIKQTGLPVIAAGGVSTGAQMAAALCLGASGVITGTRLIASCEAKVADDYKKAVIETGPEGIICCDHLTGNPANWIASSVEGVTAGPDLKSKRWKTLWSAGQSVAQVDEVLPAGEIINEMANECRHILNQTQSIIMG